MTNEEYAKEIGVYLGEIATWQDFYDAMRRMFHESLQASHPVAMFPVFCLYQSFIEALQDMPEEGDIKKIVAYMYELLHHKAEERFNVHIMLKDDEEGFVMKKAKEPSITSTIIAGDSSKVH